MNTGEYECVGVYMKMAYVEKRKKSLLVCSVVFFSMDFPLCVYTQEYSQTHDSLFPNTESVFNINYLCERVYSACICVG